jgi:hypothetical protein
VIVASPSPQEALTNASSSGERSSPTAVTPPDPFVWEERDAAPCRCTVCGGTVRAEVLDLHRCEGGA